MQPQREKDDVLKRAIQVNEVCDLEQILFEEIWISLSDHFLKVSIIDKKNQQNIENVDDAVNIKLIKSINLIQQGINLIKKNIE